LKLMISDDTGINEDDKPAPNSKAFQEAIEPEVTLSTRHAAEESGLTVVSNAEQQTESAPPKQLLWNQIRTVDHKVSTCLIVCTVLLTVVAVRN
jgi:hypothetical protein